MKKITDIVILTVLASTTLIADFTRIEMGAGAYSSTPSGKVSYTATANDISNEKGTINPYVWVYIKHPIPTLPNIRLEYASIETNGIANGTFKDFSASSSATKLEMTQYDIIPYYNLLDNTAWLTLDVGLDIKFLDTNYRADNVTGSTGTTYNESSMLVLPLIYTRMRVEIPTTNIGIEADAKFIKYSSSNVYDARIKLDYTLDFMPAIEPAIEVGYRVQKYDIDEADLNGKVNLEFSGVYVGAMIRF